MLRQLVRAAVPLALAVAVASAAAAQTPVPFPRPGQPKPSRPEATPPQAPPQAAGAPQAAGEPSEATLGVPLYPGSQFIASYDAGMGQRYYLFGTESNFEQIVGYYRTILKQKGDLVFEEPPAGRQGDLGAVVASHAVNSQSSHDVKCRAFCAAARRPSPGACGPESKGPRCGRSRALVADRKRIRLRSWS